MSSASSKHRRVEFYADRFVQHSAITDAIEEMKFVYDLSGLIQRPINIAITGEGGVGKTSLVNHFISIMLKTKPQYSHFGFRQNISFFDLEPNITPTKLINRILSPENPRKASTSLSDFAVQAQEMRLKMVIIDEFSQLDRAQRNHREQCIHQIRWIGNNLKIPFIISGTAGVERLFKSDKEMGSRFKVLKMDRWKPGREFEYFVFSYLKTLPAFEGIDTLSKELFDLLLHGQSNTTHDIKQTLGEAAYQAYCHQDIDNIHLYARKIAMKTGYLANG